MTDGALRGRAPARRRTSSSTSVDRDRRPRAIDGADGHHLAAGPPPRASGETVTVRRRRAARGVAYEVAEVGERRLRLGDRRARRRTSRRSRRRSTVAFAPTKGDHGTERRAPAHRARRRPDRARRAARGRSCAGTASAAPSASTACDRVAREAAMQSPPGPAPRGRADRRAARRARRSHPGLVVVADAGGGRGGRSPGALPARRSGWCVVGPEGGLDRDELAALGTAPAARRRPARPAGGDRTGGRRGRCRSRRRDAVPTSPDRAAASGDA